MNYRSTSLFSSTIHFLICIFEPLQIERHFSLNSTTPELNLEKLQLIVTAKASTSFKIKWLEYLNSSVATREARRVPPKTITEEKLSLFLAKAVWWAGVSQQSSLEFGVNGCIQSFRLVPACVNWIQLYLNFQISDQAQSMYDEMIRQDRILVDMTVASEPMSLSEYIEDCRMKLWDTTFSSLFRGQECFKKIDEFQKYKGADLVVKRVIFRYNFSADMHCF